MRHGEAEEWADGGDAQRELTSRGRTMAIRAGAMLRTSELLPTVAIASPFVRAQQTLRGVLEASGVRLDGATEPKLVPGTPPAAAIDALIAAAPSNDGRLLAVTHNPCVTHVLSQLVGGGSRMCFAVSVGDVAHLSIDPSDRSAVLLGYVPSRVLQALAR
jgi:phosphohistidine phosphatase SixA